MKFNHYYNVKTSQDTLFIYKPPAMKNLLAKITLQIVSYWTETWHFCHVADGIDTVITVAYSVAYMLENAHPTRQFHCQ